MQKIGRELNDEISSITDELRTDGFFDNFLILFRKEKSMKLKEQLIKYVDAGYPINFYQFF